MAGFEKLIVSSDPIYNAMFDTYYKADTLSSMDLKDTQTWSDLYK